MKGAAFFMFSKISYNFARLSEFCKHFAAKNKYASASVCAQIFLKICYYFQKLFIFNFSFPFLRYLRY